MHFKPHRTVLQVARSTNLEEFVQNYDLANLLDAPNNFLENGAPLVKCLPASKASNRLMEHGRLTTTAEAAIQKGLHIKTTKELSTRLTSTIINITKAGNYKACINTLHKIQNSIGNKFYGALFIHKKTILNPLHPITAMLMADEKKYKALHDLEYRIAIYAYKDEEEYQELHTLYNSSTADADHIEKNLNALIQVTAHQVKTTIKLADVDHSTSNSEVANLSYQISKEQGEAPDYEFYLSAHQMLTAGVVLPWYGSSFIKLNGSTSGFHISPMWSCNISGGRDIDGGADIPWASVCTGSIPNSTLKGLRTLNHANLLSPFNKHILAPGGLVYAQMAVNKSFQIYRSAGFIEGTLYEKTYLNENT